MPTLVKGSDCDRSPMDAGFVGLMDGDGCGGGDGTSGVAAGDVDGVETPASARMSSHCCRRGPAITACVVSGMEGRKRGRKETLVELSFSVLSSPAFSLIAHLSPSLLHPSFGRTLLKCGAQL